jgi:radical SAM protein with 4Fe4S-binding SPASM domain
VPIKFSDQIIMFKFASTPLVGNLNNGYSIGLTSEGSELCKRLFDEDVAETEIASVDESLLRHLQLGDFFGRTGTNPAPRSAYLHVTQRCNLSCVGCYSLDSGRNTLPDPTHEQLTRAISELAKVGVKSLVISGGEPFLREDLPDLLAYARTIGGIETINIATNGTKVSKGSLERLAPYVSRISVSFDGASALSTAHIRGEQRFDALIASIRLIQEAGIPAQITPTIHAGNTDEMGQYLALSKELGALLSYSLFSGSYADPQVERLLPHEDKLRELGEATFHQSCDALTAVNDSPLAVNLSVARKCGAGKETLSVAADGTLYPCHMLHRDEFRLGNLFCDDITSLRFNEIPCLDKIREQPLDSNCSACEYKWFCRGGCKARSYLTYGEFSAKDPYCAMFTAFYSAFAQYLSARLTQRKEVQ